MTFEISVAHTRTHAVTKPNQTKLNHSGKKRSKIELIVTKFKYQYSIWLNEGERERERQKQIHTYKDCHKNQTQTTNHKQQQQKNGKNGKHIIFKTKLLIY